MGSPSSATYGSADDFGLKSELEFLRSLADILSPPNGDAPDVRRALDAISTMRMALSKAPRTASETCLATKNATPPEFQTEQQAAYPGLNSPAASAPSCAQSAERVATPAENLRIMAARLSLVMSPAEKREVEEAAALLEPSAPSSGGVAPEVRLNNDGTLDEVCTPLFHLEQMDYNHWFLEIVHGGQAVAVWLHAKGKITASYEHRRTERGDQL